MLWQELTPTGRVVGHVQVQYVRLMVCDSPRNSGTKAQRNRRKNDHWTGTRVIQDGSEGLGSAMHHSGCIDTHGSLSIDEVRKTLPSPSVWRIELTDVQYAQSHGISCRYYFLLAEMTARICVYCGFWGQVEWPDPNHSNLPSVDPCGTWL